MVRFDHPSNDKGGGVCIYFKSSLLIQTLNISVLHECINMKITIDGKLCNLSCLHKSLSQNMEEFETFVKNLELNLKFNFNMNSYLTVFIGDFNAKSHYWYKGRLEQSDFNGQSIGGKMEIRLEKLALFNFKAYGWQK